MAGTAHKEERREGYVEIPAKVVEELRDHINNEDSRDAKWEQMFENGSHRMDEIETDLKTISGIVAPIQGFVKAMWMTSAIFGALVAILCWIMIEKNTDIKDMQKTLNAHSVQIDRTLTMLEQTIKSNDKEHDQIEKHIDRARVK